MAIVYQRRSGHIYSKYDFKLFCSEILKWLLFSNIEVVISTVSMDLSYFGLKSWNGYCLPAKKG